MVTQTPKLSCSYVHELTTKMSVTRCNHTVIPYSLIHRGGQQEIILQNKKHDQI